MTISPQQEQDTSAQERMLHYKTNFGEIALRDDRLLSFPEGLLGLSWCTVFGLSRMPGTEADDNTPLILMHCVNDPSITFLVADPDALGTPIHEEDRKKAMKEVSFNQKDTQFLVILTLYNDGASAGYLTANLRAPVLIDSATRVGRQHVLNNKEYSTQHKI